MWRAVASNLHPWTGWETPVLMEAVLLFHLHGHCFHGRVVRSRGGETGSIRRRR